MTNHPELAYRLWVEHGRDSHKVAQLLRAGNDDPDDPWTPLNVTKRDVDQWALERHWHERQFVDSTAMAPDRFFTARDMFEQSQVPAARLLRDVLDGKLDNVDPRILRERIKVAMHISNVAGHTPATLMDTTKRVTGPQKDYRAEIAGLSLEEKRQRALQGLPDQIGSSTPVLNRTIGHNDDDAHVIDVVSDDQRPDSQPADRTPGRPPGAP